MADALGPWQDEAVLDGRSRLTAVLWRPLLAEGLVGSGHLDQAAAVLDQLRAGSGQVAYLTPALLWGGKVIVSTGTKNLQDQLFLRDIPMIKKVLNAPVSVALMQVSGKEVTVRIVELESMRAA